MDEGNFVYGIGVGLAIAAFLLVGLMWMFVRQEAQKLDDKTAVADSLRQANDNLHSELREVKSERDKLQEGIEGIMERMPAVVFSEIVADAQQSEGEEDDDEEMGKVKSLRRRTQYRG